MSDDFFGEFLGRLGKEVPIYRECDMCGDLYIVNPDTYDKPKTGPCDPGFCEYLTPYCICTDQSICTEAGLEHCTYPDCAHGSK